jgi:hypothetical protein
MCLQIVPSDRTGKGNFDLFTAFSFKRLQYELLELVFGSLIDPVVNIAHAKRVARQSPLEIQIKTLPENRKTEVEDYLVESFGLNLSEAQLVVDEARWVPLAG